MLIRFFCAFGVCLTAHGQSVERKASEALDTFEVYPGVEATLFASEPGMLSPTNLDVDHRGRVWVIEVVNYREHAKNNLRPEGDRVLILEDVDGDGKADTNKVFYQGRDIDAALGICVLGNKVIVSSAPSVIVFTDEDGDDKPDKKELLFTNSGRVQSDHSLHSFLFGPDGKLYWNMGNHGQYVHDAEGNLVEDKAGFPIFDSAHDKRPATLENVETPYWGGMIFRCELDGSNMEVLAHNFRNNYEVALDSFGNLWQSDNDDDGNRACRINYILEFGNYGYFDQLTGAHWRQPRTGWHDEIPSRHWHQNDPGVVPNLLQTGAGAPAGITAYEGNLLPETINNTPLLCEAGPGVVWSVQTEPHGAGFVAKTIDLMKTTDDKWVRPVDVTAAPDGALYVSDWYDPVIGWDRQYDTERGRIFRLAPPGHKSSVPELGVSTPEGAAEALKSPNHATRYLAWTALHEMQEQAEPALLKLYNSDDARMRARALWLLTKIDGRGEEHLNKALQDDDHRIRVTALRAARQMPLDIVSIVDRMADDPNYHVLRDCAIALRYEDSDAAAQAWAQLAARHQAGDRWYLEALGIGADRKWDKFLGAWFDLVGKKWDSPAGHDIIWRSRAPQTPGYLANVLIDPDLEVEASERYVRALDFQEDTSTKQAALETLLDRARKDKSDRATFVAAEALLRMDDYSIDKNRDFVVALAERARDLESFGKLVQQYALTEHYPALLEVAAANFDNPTGLAAARTIIQSDSEELISDFVSEKPANDAGYLMDALGNTRLEEAVQPLKTVLLNEDLEWRVREQAVRGLAKTWEGGNTLVALKRAGDFPEELDEVAGAALSKMMNIYIREDANELFPTPPMKGDVPLPQMTELLTQEGNVARGKEVFVSATCIECHIVNGEGTDFGPDLSTIGTKLPKEGLYEAILDPSAGISPTYAPMLLDLKSGESVAGFIESETDEGIRFKMEGGVVQEYAHEDIAERFEQSISVMPSDLQRQMTAQELVDLVEYLTTLTGE